MALEMKDACERCHGPINPQDKAYICSFECTFCHGCTLWLGFSCPNCGGELVRRPRQKTVAVTGDVKSDRAEAEAVTEHCRVAS
jgi:hypothetical protein